MGTNQYPHIVEEIMNILNQNGQRSSKPSSHQTKVVFAQSNVNRKPDSAQHMPMGKNQHPHTIEETMNILHTHRKMVKSSSKSANHQTKVIFAKVQCK